MEGEIGLYWQPRGSVVVSVPVVVVEVVVSPVDWGKKEKSSLCQHLV